jgi:hypothetical protein
MESEDWKEWQAGYFSSACLIPEEAARSQLRAFHRFDTLAGPLELHSSRCDEFLKIVARRFGTSLQCAQGRLERLGLIYSPLSQSELREIYADLLPRGLVHCSIVLPRVVAAIGLRVLRREI